MFFHCSVSWLCLSGVFGFYRSYHAIIVFRVLVFFQETTVSTVFLIFLSHGWLSHGVIWLQAYKMKTSSFTFANRQACEFLILTAKPVEKSENRDILFLKRTYLFICVSFKSWRKGGGKHLQRVSLSTSLLWLPLTAVEKYWDAEPSRGTGKFFYLYSYSQEKDSTWLATH